MIIAVDFDGTLHTGRWPGIGVPAPYAKEAMETLKREGHFLILWTCREGDRLTEAVNWMLEKGIPFDCVNDHKPGSWEQYGNKSRKVYAHLYVDDRQVGGLPDWLEVVDYVREMEAEYLKQLNTKDQ